MTIHGVEVRIHYMQPIGFTGKNGKISFRVAPITRDSHIYYQAFIICLPVSGKSISFITVYDLISR